MIKIYYRSGCGSSKRAFSWFEKYNLQVKKYQISQITKADLIKLLQLSDQGFKDIIKKSSRSSLEVKKALEYMECLNFNEALDFLLTHSYILQTPIILKGERHLIGYNEDEIRIFLTKNYRRQNF